MVSMDPQRRVRGAACPVADRGKGGRKGDVESGAEGLVRRAGADASTTASSASPGEQAARARAKVRERAPSTTTQEGVDEGAREEQASHDYAAAYDRLGRANCKSQDREDVALYEHFFAGEQTCEQKGRFVEMGALDGVTYSNTYAYEKALGWEGVLIEANPLACTKLARRRPRAVRFCSAVSNDSKPILFESGVYPTVFAAVSEMDADWRAEWHFGAGTTRQITPTKVLVPSSPLGQLLRRANVTRIDLFSLDVEGSELRVLETMDWSIPVHVWMVEVLNEERLGERIRRLFEENGYIRRKWLHDTEGRLARNHLYVRDANAKCALVVDGRNASVSSPPSVGRRRSSPSVHHQRHLGVAGRG